jgi:hypothetical protein
MYPIHPQRNLKDMIEEQIAVTEYLKELQKKGEKKPEPWYKGKLSVWEVALCGSIFTFFAALPLTIWIVEGVHTLKIALDAVFK